VFGSENYELEVQKETIQYIMRFSVKFQKSRIQRAFNLKWLNSILHKSNVKPMKSRHSETSAIITGTK